jgi:hypothetical protein
MPWVALCPLTFISYVRTLQVDEDKKWEEIDKAREYLNNLLTTIEDSGMEICHLNFKLPLHGINCVLRCTTVPKKETIFIMDIIQLD